MTVNATRSASATHQVFNQSPVFEEVDLLNTDIVLRSCLKQFASPDSGKKLSKFGIFTGSAAAREIGRLANENPPRLKNFDSRGYRQDFVEFHPAYHAAMRHSMELGLHASTWDYLQEDKPPAGPAHVERVAGSYLAVQMEPGHCCPITMTHASLASLKDNSDLLSDWLPKILSRSYDPSFQPVTRKKSATIGMGMTEKQGGTDVRANTSEAAPNSGNGSSDYTLSGHKWFVSAPMSDAFLMLAQAPAGLTCFFVPRFLPDGSLNGLHIQRLKDKLGNRSNASSEMEFDSAQGWRIGEEGRGVPTIIEMVTLTRLDCAVSSAAMMRQALAHAVHHCRYRKVFDKELADQPLMAQVLADLALDWEAATWLSFRLAKSFDGHGSEREQIIRRVMTPVTKFWCCKMAPAFVYEAMECLGGNGYIEDGILARLYREAPVNAIWEGSGNVMCLDLLRILHSEKSLFDQFAQILHEMCRDDTRLANACGDLFKSLASAVDAEGAAREFVEKLARLFAASQLRNFAPEFVADGFINSRITGDWRHCYGAGAYLPDKDRIVARVGQF
ncbi:MAG: acyl-CoA dehydrogenase family protein [Methyloligellaceae bacterium]